jgi:hypothetical protein
LLIAFFVFLLRSRCWSKGWKPFQMLGIKPEKMREQGRKKQNRGAERERQKTEPRTAENKESQNRGRQKQNQGSREREDWRDKNSEAHWPANTGAPTSSPVAPPPSPSEQT